MDDTADRREDRGHGPDLVAVEAADDVPSHAGHVPRGGVAQRLRAVVSELGEHDAAVDVRAAPPYPAGGDHPIEATRQPLGESCRRRARSHILSACSGASERYTSSERRADHA